MKKTAKIAALIVILAAIFFGIYYMANPTLFQTEVSYDEFITCLDNGKIDHADVDENAGKVTYTLKGSDRHYYTAYPDSEDFKLYMLESGVELGIGGDDVFDVIMSVLTLLVTCAVAVLLLSVAAPVNKFKVVKSQDIKVKFADVAGNDEIKDELMLISSMMKDEKYKKNGAKIPKGVLLQGPPGNGKTMLAKAFAGETGVSFISTSSSDFSSQFVGLGSVKIKQLFKYAKSNAPCVVFIDEIDGVGSKRMNAKQAAEKEMNTILTTLLNEIDGFDGSENIMVLAATNRIGDLDAALVRPGRFDRRFIIANPDKQARIDLFREYTADSGLSDDVDFDSLANKTYDCSAAQIMTLCNEAVLVSLGEGKDKVNMQDFETAILKSAIMGSVKKQSLLTEKDRLITAYHEAGHAVMTYYYTDEDVTTVSIKPTTSGAGGFTVSSRKNEDNLQSLGDIYGKIKALYGGRAAEYIRGGEKLENVSTGALQDIKEATNLVSQYVCLLKGIDLPAYGKYGVKAIADESQKLLEEIWAQTVSDLKSHWSETETLANLLIEKETVSGSELFNKH